MNKNCISATVSFKHGHGLSSKENLHFLNHVTLPKPAMEDRAITWSLHKVRGISPGRTRLLHPVAFSVCPLLPSPGFLQT